MTARSDDQAERLLAEAVEGVPSAIRKPGEPLRLFIEISRHRQLFVHWFPFARALLRGRLAAADRERVILTVLSHERCEYELVNHVLIARELGLPTEEIRWLQGAAARAEASQRTRELSRATTLMLEGDAERATAIAAELLDEEQLREWVFVVGQYWTLCRLACGLRLEPHSWRAEALSAGLLVR